MPAPLSAQRDDVPAGVGRHLTLRAHVTHGPHFPARPCCTPRVLWNAAGIIRTATVVVHTTTVPVRSARAAGSQRPRRLGTPNQGETPTL